MKRSLRILALITGVTSLGAPVTADSPSSAHIDHILLGVAELDSATAELAKAFGVTPVYGGKHPRGTHNALLSLGPTTYLELIALQPGVKGKEIGIAVLDHLTAPTPIGWAVSGSDLSTLRAQVERAGFALSAPSPGSRTTPKGNVLRWQSFDLADEPAGAPFFIAWSPGTPHPASTSPPGCTLDSFKIASPAAARLRALVSKLTLPVTVTEAADLSFSLTLTCPKGRIFFPTASPPSSSEPGLGR